jgi:hypothetical protein
VNEKLYTYNMRIPPELFELLRKSAEEHKRSINKEVEYILDLYISRTQGQNKAD